MAACFVLIIVIFETVSHLRWYEAILMFSAGLVLTGAGLSQVNADAEPEKDKFAPAMSEYYKTTMLRAWKMLALSYAMQFIAMALHLF